MERKIHFREIWLRFLGIWGEAELILRIWGAKKKYFQGAEVFSFGDWGDQYIIFRHQGSIDSPGGLIYRTLSVKVVLPLLYMPSCKRIEL